MLVYEYGKSHAAHDEASNSGRRDYRSRRNSGSDNGQTVVCRDSELEISLQGSDSWTDDGIYIVVLSGILCMEASLFPRAMSRVHVDPTPRKSVVLQAYKEGK